MIKKIIEWFKSTHTDVIERELTYAPFLIEFDRNKDYIISLPGSTTSEAKRFVDVFKKACEGEGPAHIFINKPITLREKK